MKHRGFGDRRTPGPQSCLGYSALLCDVGQDAQLFNARFSIPHDGAADVRGVIPKRRNDVS